MASLRKARRKPLQYRALDEVLADLAKGARRGFHEALAKSKLAAWFVYQIGLLYDVERELREQKAGPGLKQAMRVWQAQPVLKRLRGLRVALIGQIEAPEVGRTIGQVH